ncbi:small subunit of serine palmitoyltransferase-like protein [Fennellomyces sp. T-0311]|nr:small subunit of serine palmitoyltransferase-like protein [Fennellomyces sp. T-0311]
MSSSHRGLSSSISTLIYKYEVQTVLYMLEPWEKALFNVILLSIISLSFMTVFQYTPLLYSKLTA